MLKICSLSLFVLFFISCTSKKAELKTEKEPLKYAKNFAISTEQGFKVLHILNPWQKGQFLSEILLCSKTSDVPEVLKSKYSVLQTPVKRLASFSHTNVGFLTQLDKLDCVKALGTPKTIYNEKVYVSYLSGEVSDLGSDLQLDLERLVNTSSDLIMKSGYPQSIQNDEHLRSLGIPVLYNVEWMESNLLARAEWIKVLGLLTNSSEKADSIFNGIEKRYHQLIKKTAQLNSSPKVMMGNDFKGVWYIPGGKSYLAELLKKINVRYFLESDSSSGSKAFSYEIVLDEMMKADIWIYSGSVISQQSLKDIERYKMFKPVKTNKVYGPFNRINDRWANDYWENGIVRPDLVLADLLTIFYPELELNHSLHFYKNLD